MALRKPSAFFGKNSDENNFPIVESDNTLREELNKVENLSEQINQLQQELTQKVVKTDLENLVVSQINEMRDNFEYLKNEIQQSNRGDLKKFKETLSNITEVVNNFVENEIPKYKKQITSNEVRVSTQFVNFKEEIEEKVEKFYDVLNEFNDVVQIIDTVSNIEQYIEHHHSDLITLREEVFEEIKQIPVGNIQENLERLEKKIDYIRETYSRIEPGVVAKEIIQEGLLNEPPETDNSDPLTPLNQNFVTLDQLQDHYRLFINRIQQQLSTFGGGGETKLKYLDDIVGISTNASVYDGMFLSYDHTLGKFKFKAVSGGGGSGDYASVAGIATYAVTSGISTYSSISGVSTYSSTSGISTYSSLSGISTYSQISGISTYSSLSGIATYALTSGIATYANISGIATYAQTAGIATSAGTATTATNLSDAANILTGTINKDRIATTNALTVLGDLYVSNNISFGGTVTQLNTEQLNIVDADIVLGIGTSFSPSDNTANHGGIAIASTEGSPLVDLNIVPGETNPSTYKKIMWFKGSTIGAGLTDAWLFNYAVGIGSTQVPNGVRLAVGNIRLTDNTVTATTFSGSLSGNATSSTYSSTAGVATVAQGLTGTPNITVGIVTATSYNGSGATLTGVITSLVAGTNVTITQSSGIATISATGGGGGGSQTLDQTLALGNTSALGMSVGVITATTLNVTGIATIGTGIVTTLRGTNINYTGISTFTSTFLTNLNVSGVATIGTGIVTTLRGTTLNYTGVSTFSSGPVLISSTGTATTTGTALQPLQVTGGAYVSGSVGVGTTNPREKLEVVGGNIGIQGVGSTSRFYIQHNTAQNSLDFVFI